MIDRIVYVVSVAVCLAVLAVLVGAIIRGAVQGKPDERRDLCKHEGCGVVHSMPCEDAVIIHGMPFICERRYNHRPDHEADAGGWVVAWSDDHPGRCNPQQRNALIHLQARLRAERPFPRLIL